MAVATEQNDLRHTKHGQRLLVFECGGQQCALPLDNVKEIIPMASLSVPLGTPNILDGFLNIEKVAVPVIKLALVFGKIPDDVQLHTPLIIIHTQAGMFALRVSRVLYIATIDKTTTRPLLDQHIASSSVILNGQIIAILATDRLLHAREISIIEELRSREEKRGTLLDTEVT